MKRLCVIAFAAACGTGSHSTPKDHVKDDVPRAGSNEPSRAAAKVDASAGSAQPTRLTKVEIEDAIHGLGSEHGEGGVRNIEWWRTNAAAVRPHLRAMLEDGSDDGQADRWAIRILGDIGDAADVEVLANVLRTWKLDTARWGAAAALGVHPAASARDALIAATAHDNEGTASCAIDGLGARKNDDIARAKVELLLDSKNPTLRFHAVHALAKMGGSRDALVKRRKIEKDAEVKAANREGPRGSKGAMTAATDERSLRIEAVYARAMLAVAERHKLADTIAPLRSRREQLGARLAKLPTESPVGELARQLGLAQADLLWTCVADSVEPRLTVHVESLGGGGGRKGLSIAID